MGNISYESFVEYVSHKKFHAIADFYDERRERVNRIFIGVTGASHPVCRQMNYFRSVADTFRRIAFIAWPLHWETRHAMLSMQRSRSNATVVVARSDV